LKYIRIIEYIPVLKLNKGRRRPDKIQIKIKMIK
jgi:hypothetical protein